MKREEIKSFLPHREPMLLVDEVAEAEGLATARFRVTGEEFFLQGHFPGYPVVPGVILCEIMAQSCCILIREELEQGRTPLYIGIEHVRFRQQVRPGDTIVTEGRITQRHGLTFFVEAASSVEGRLACSGRLIFTLIDNKPK